MPDQVLGLRLFTNRGRALIARALKSTPGDNGTVQRDGVTYEKVNVLYLDDPFSSGTLKGFFGRSDDGAEGKIFRLGIIWGRLPEVTAEEAEGQFLETTDTIDGEDRAILQTDALQQMQQKLNAAQKALEQKDGQISELQKLRENKPFGEAQCGFFSARDKGWPGGENARARCWVDFARNYAAPPKLLFGLSIIDAEHHRNRVLSLGFPEVKPNGFSVLAEAVNGCYGHNMGCNWMTLPDDLHMETGIVHTYGTNQADFDGFSRHVFFSQSFPTPPKVCIWLQAFEWTGGDFISIKCYPQEVSCDSFVMRVESWANRRFRNVKLQYLAYPAEEDGKRVKSGRNTVNRAQKEQSLQYPYYGGPFKNTPKTFIAISEIDFGIDKNLRFRCSANAPNNEQLAWKFGTWDDTNMDHAEVQWIALE